MERERVQTVESSCIRSCRRESQILNVKWIVVQSREGLAHAIDKLDDKFAKFLIRIG